MERSMTLGGSGRQWRLRVALVATAAAALLVVVAVCGGGGVDWGAPTLWLASLVRSGATRNVMSFNVGFENVGVSHEEGPDWCDKAIKRTSDMYSQKIGSYHKNCGLQPTDVAKQNGELVVVHGERICSASCRGDPEAHFVLPNFFALESRCAGHEGLPELADQSRFIQVLDNASSHCATSATTTTTLPPFDFTVVLNTIGSPPAILQLPGEMGSYSCCCRADLENEAVDCLLQDQDPRTIRNWFADQHRRRWSGHHRRRRTPWLTEGTAQDTDCPLLYHLWNELANSTWGQHPWFGRLANVGRCIVRSRALPDSLRGRSHEDINRILRRVTRQMSTQF